METSEILKRVRQIEIKTRGLSSNIFAGEYHSAFKGRGMAFSEVREYQYDYNVSFGENENVNNMPAYLTIFCWKRLADN